MNHNRHELVPNLALVTALDLERFKSEAFTIKVIHSTTPSPVNRMFIIKVLGRNGEVLPDIDVFDTIPLEPSFNKSKIKWTNDAWDALAEFSESFLKEEPIFVNDDF